jgi:hypothetical protein
VAVGNQGTIAATSAIASRLSQGGGMNVRYYALSFGLCVLAGFSLLRTTVPPEQAHTHALGDAGDGTAAPFVASASAQRSAPNRAPAISGTAPKSVLQGAPYAFQPVAADADGNSLTFSIVNRPAWATFDAATGRLEGTPGLGDVGTFSGIVIGVSDGSKSAKLAALSIKVQGVLPGWARLTWNPPPRANGTQALKVQGFKVYWGTKAGRYASSATIMNPSATAYVVESLTPNTYHFVVKSISSTGDEKVYARPKSVTIP